jgi:hypothetical protein
MRLPPGRGRGERQAAWRSTERQAAAAVLRATAPSIRASGKIEVVCPTLRPPSD